MSTRLLAKNGPAPAAGAAKAHAATGGRAASEHGSLSEVGAKLSNPVSEVWALFTQFSVTSSDGDANLGGEKLGGNMIFQPILPIPLFGKGANAWRLIIRPNVPLLIGSPVPEEFDNFHHKTGLGDIELPLLVSIPAGNWILAAGPAVTGSSGLSDQPGPLVTKPRSGWPPSFLSTTGGSRRVATRRTSPTRAI
jgi:hypothetical protein